MESPDPLFNAKGDAHGQAKEQVTARPGGCVTWNPGRSETGGAGGEPGGANGRTWMILLYNFKCFTMFCRSAVSFFGTTLAPQRENRKNAKKAMCSGSPSSVVHFLFHF